MLTKRQRVALQDYGIPPATVHSMAVGTTSSVGRALLKAMHDLNEARDDLASMNELLNSYRKVIRDLN